MMNKLFSKLAKKPIQAIIEGKLIADVVCMFICYELLPYLLNYPPGSINTPFQLSVNPYYYAGYYFLIFVVGICLDLLITRYMLKALKGINENDIENMFKARKVCYQFPTRALLFTTIIIPVLVVGGLLLLTKTELILTIKIIMLVIVFLGVPNLFIYFWSRAILREVLIQYYNKEVYEKEKIRQTNIYNKVIIEILPSITISMILVFMFVIANVTNYMADNYFQRHKLKLENIKEDIVAKNIKIIGLNQYLEDKLNDEQWFVKINDTYIGNTEVNQFMANYIEFYGKENDGRIYSYYGENTQGAIIYLNIENQEIILGIVYSIPNNLFVNLLIIIFSCLIVNALIIFLSSRAIGSNLDNINNNLSKILHKEKIEFDLLPITSTDEIGRLTSQINKVQQKTNKYIKIIEENQYTMQRQAQFAIIGEFAGGLAHDLNSPLSAVKLDISTLKKYLNSDKISANDNVKNSLEEILENIDSSLNNMGNIISGVRNQIRTTGDSDKEEFLLIDVVNGIKILFRSLLMKNNCQLEIEISEDLKIFGEKNKLDRVIGNLVKNSIDAYVGNRSKGIINIKARENEDKIVIEVSDMAGGIDDDIKEKIFKEIKTTKNEKGTGFGLYYSNTIIESSFKGKMYFETEKNVGTKFFIEIPIIKEEQ